MYLNVMRVLQGKLLYLPPSAEFVPSLYTPLFYYAAGVFAAITGNIMFSMRIVSILGTLFLAGSIFGICRQLGMKALEGYLAVAIFFASYKIAGFYYDLGRVDNLALGLMGLGSWMALRRQNSFSYGALTGVVLGLAFLSKQHAILSAGFLFIFLAYRKEWKSAFGLAAALAVMLAGFYLVSFLTNGFWTFFYTFTVPTASPIQKRRLLVFLWEVFLPTYWPMLVIILIGAAAFWRRTDKSGWMDPMAALACVMLPLAIFGVGTYIKIWGYVNGLGGVAAAVGLAGAYAVHQTTRSFPAFEQPRMSRAAALGVIFLAIPLQLWILRYDPRPQIPAPEAAQEGYRLIEQIKSLPGPVYSPAASYLMDMAGMTTNYHISQYSDIQLGSKFNPIVLTIYNQYDAQVTSPLKTGYYQSAIMPNGNFFDVFFEESQGYRCIDFPGPVLESIDGATTFLKGICARTPP